MKNLYLVVVLVFFLTACGVESRGGSNGGTPPLDAVPPVVAAPASATFAAIDAAGTPASSDAISAFLQSATASDNVDGSVSVSSDAPDDFPLGPTTVVFSATDAAGNKGTATTVVTVTDQAEPNLVVPEGESFVATSAAGISATDAALVDLLAKASASDNVDTVVTISNNAPAIFPIGETLVKFTATDAAGNEADRTTLVTVTGAEQEGKGEKGPLFRATVFFDYDGDKQLDENEPRTLTDINGDYKLAETSNAPEDYLVVLLMNPDTIDGITGESYADSSVTLEAVKDSKVITPMTTLYSIAVSDLDEGEELSSGAFAIALGLPEGLDINTYSAYAKDEEGGYIEVDTASQVEAVSQSLMTTLQVISESVVNISKTALRSDSGVTQAQASNVALKSLASVIAATAADNSVGGGAVKSVDLTTVDDIAEVNSAVLESLNSDDADSLGALLETTAVAAGTEVDTAAAEVTGSVILSLSTNTIATVSKAFKDVTVASFGQVEASAVSRLKAQVVSEIAGAAEIVVAAVSEQQDANETVELVAEDVDVSAVITLDNEESLNATVAQNVQEVEAYLLTTVAPVIESGENFVAAENQTSVGSVIATDTAGDVLSYRLSGADAGALTISSSGVISFVTTPDFETKTLYSATVTVTDNNDNSVSQIIAISITDANDDAPAITSPSSFTVDENQSVIGSVVATSTSPGAVLTFSLIGGDAAALTISANGLLGFVEEPDFEDKASYSTTVVVGDGNNDTPDTQAAITVSIVNLNDSAPVITSVDQYTVQENSKSIGAITATDEDFSALTYELSGTDASAFKVSVLGYLSFKTAPNFEVKSNYSLIVTVSDGVNSASLPLTVIVKDTDDVSPEFESGALFTAAENQVAIGTVEATDTDTDDNLIVFSVSGNDLAITPEGVLSFVALPDYEANASYTATVTATDGINQRSQTIVVTVTDVDDVAPVFTSLATFDVVENSSAIGTVTATDADSDNGSIIFSVSGNDVAITPEGVLSFVALPDYEANASYTATVTATDGINQRSQTIVVTVTDVDDVAPVFTSLATFDVVENSSAIGTVTATDADSDNGSIIFSVSGDVLAITDDGVLSFVAAPNYEVQASYTATITAADGTNSTEQIITVTVSNVDDEAPNFTSAAAFTGAENQTAIGSVTAQDADSASVVFSISSDDLVITPEGVLSFLAAPDYELQASYSATITATDGTNLAIQVITVVVTDKDDTFTLSDTAVTLTDYYPLDGSTVTNTLAYSIGNGRGNVDLRTAPLNLTNIENALYSGDFKTPVISFGLSTLPIGSGAGTVSIDLIDGVDGVIDAGERQVKADIAVEWESDGTTASITVPTQTINASYKTGAGVQIDVQVANVDSDVLTVTNNGVAYPATLEVKLFSLISQLSALPLADILSAGIYHVDVSTSLPLKAATGEILGGVSAIVEIVDAFKLADATVTLKDPSAVDGSVTSSLHETSLVDGFLTVDMRDAPLSLLNIEKGLYGLDFTSPKVLFGLSAIPSGTGKETVTINLIDGTDAVRGAGERQITVALEIEWDADGNVAAITVPAQDLTAYYLTGDGVRFDVALANADLDVLSVTSAGADYPASLEIKLLSLITKLSGLPLSDLLSAGEFHLEVTTSMPLIAPTGSVVDGLRAVIEIADDAAPVFTSVASFSAAENQTVVGTVAAVAFASDSVTYSISGSDLQIDEAGVVSFISAPDYEANATYIATVTAKDGDRSTTQVITVVVTDKDDTFTLSDTAVTLTDYYPLDGSTVTNTLAYSIGNGRGNVDLRTAPLNLTNIENALYSGDFKTPVISFGLSTLPIGSGAGTVSIDLIDGVDGVIDAGERQVKADIAVEWESDGTTASITVPTQTINASYKTGAGVQIDVQVANVDSDVLTVTNNGVAYPATLEVKLFSLISQLSALPLADILSAGIYHVDVSTSLPLKAATGEILGGVSAIVEIVDAFKLADATVTLKDPSAVDGSVTSSLHETSLVDGFLTVDMRDAPLSLLNIEKGLYGLDFTSPKVLFGLSAIPSGTGKETVTINLIDGTDAVRGAGERQITVALEIEWDADGNVAAITVPAQDLTAYYLTGDGVRFDVALANADLDVLSVTSAGADYPASLEIKLLSLITKLSGLPLSDLLSAGEFHLEVTTSMPLIAPTGSVVDGLRAVIEIADDVAEEIL